MTSAPPVFTLGDRSEAELAQVHPRLAAVVRRAIAVTDQDFTVHDGARTLEEQREHVRRGASKTMRSRHLVRPDGFGRAVDLVPWVAGRPAWIWTLPADKGEPAAGGAFAVALAMRMAAEALATPLVWGGVWDRPLLSLPGDYAGLRSAVTAYCRRHPGPDFLDGPHFELIDDD